MFDVLTFFDFYPESAVFNAEQVIFDLLIIGRLKFFHQSGVPNKAERRFVCCQRFSIC